MADATVLGTRAVRRRINAGDEGGCVFTGCDQAHRIKFRAKMTTYRVLCNVYEGGRWDRLEQYHDDCYLLAGEPHGPLVSVASTGANRLD